MSSDPPLPCDNAPPAWPPKALAISIVMCCLMAAALVLGSLARPPARSPDEPPRFVLETMIPKQFGDWRELPNKTVQVVNPQTQALLDKLYSQLLNRVYVDANGNSIMLSVAYGNDQRGELQVHKPEICYPAQGFKLHSNEGSDLITPFGNLRVRRLATSLGPRKEPVTYWITVGDTLINNKLEQRMLEMKMGFAGQVPDGLLVRVSSIDASPAHAFEVQQQFVSDLLSAMPTLDRTRLSGLTADAPLRP